MHMATDYRTALRNVCDTLSLPGGDAYTQDWAAELPEDYRSLEHLERYAAAVGAASDDVERGILMELSLDVANDLVEDGLTQAIWSPLAAELRRAPPLYAELVDRYACDGQPLEESFALTPLVRAAARRT